MKSYYLGVVGTFFGLIEAIWTFIDHLLNHALCGTRPGYKLTCKLAEYTMSAQDAIDKDCKG